MITDEAVLAISKKSPHLISIDLSGCAITDNGMLALIAAAPRLEDLVLSKAVFSEDVFVKVAQTFPNLNRIAFHGCKPLNDTVVTAFARNCRNVSTLSLAHATCTDVAIIEIGLHCSQLSVAEFVRFDVVTNQSIPHLNRCRKLQSLSLQISEPLNCESLAAIASLPRLTKLRLSGLQREAGAIHLLRTCTTLTHLFLSGKNLSDAALQAMSGLHLTYMGITRTGTMTGAGLVAFMQSHPCLQRLSVVNSSIPHETRQTLVESYPFVIEFQMIIDTV